MNINLSYGKYFLNKFFKSWRNKYLKRIIYKNPNNILLYREVLEEISEYTKESVAIIEEKCKNPIKESIEWKNATEEEIIAFYKEDKHFLYELPLWNAERNRGEYICKIIVPYLKKNKIKAILEYGGGAGDITIALARRGFKMIYSEINKGLIDFAKWRFSKRKLNIAVQDLTINSEFPSGSCVISFDVLEHLKNLPLKIKKVSNSLSRGGSFIFSGAFSGGDAHLRENEMYNNFKNLDKLLNVYGFAFDDKFAQYHFYRKLERSPPGMFF